MSHAVSPDHLQRRLDGEPLDALADELGLSHAAASRLFAVAHAGIDDLRLTRRGQERIRPCLCCGVQIISWHAGVRLCLTCRVGGPLSVDDGDLAA